MLGSGGIEHPAAALLKAGVDQFGGNNDKGPVLEAYRMWTAEFGEKSARERFERSAIRLLLNIFRTGLFENPYVDPDRTEATVGNPEFMQAGYEAQLRSVVLLKNRAGTLPASTRRSVYLPECGQSRLPVDTSLVKQYYELAESPENADFAIVFIDEPDGGCGYDAADREKGGNGYVPISLQYGDYTARHARPESIAGGDPKEPSIDRSYRGKTVRSSNREELKRVLGTKRQMGDKPVVAVVSTTRPFVPAEFEPSADAILLAFGVQRQAVLDIISGRREPSALLPMQLPADMKTVEQQHEDVPRDMVCYTDSEGNTYDFAFGLDWKGVIRDARVEKYK